MHESRATCWAIRFTNILAYACVKMYSTLFRVQCSHDERDGNNWHSRRTSNAKGLVRTVECIDATSVNMRRSLRIAMCLKKDPLTWGPKHDNKKRSGSTPERCSSTNKSSVFSLRPLGRLVSSRCAPTGSPICSRSFHGASFKGVKWRPAGTHTKKQWRKGHERSQNDSRRAHNHD